MIVQLFLEGKRQCDIRRALGVSKGHVHNVLRKEGLLKSPPSRLSEKVVQEAVRMYNDGLSAKEVAEALSVSQYDVKCALGWKLRDHGDSNHIRAVRKSPKLSETQKQLLLGTLLGDASISRNKNRGYHVRISHGPRQREYAEHKRRILGVKRIHQYKSSSNSYSKGAPLWTFWYKNAASSKYLERAVLVEGMKRVNGEWMSELNLEGVAYWFMDDGSSSRRRYCVSVRFATNGFDEEECSLLVAKLTDLGFPSTIHRAKSRIDGTGLTVSMSTKHTEDFLESMSQFVRPIPCMRYKLKTRKSS